MDYSAESTRDGVLLTRKNVSGRKIVCLDGLCAANEENPKRPREREWFIRNILEPGIKAGIINDGTNSPYDDRKPRLDHISFQGDLLEVYFGITTYQAAAADVHRSPDENRLLHQRGLDIFDDKYAFFSRAPGITAVPITMEKTVFLGQRIGTKEYEGYLNVVSGYVNYNRDNSKISLEQEAARELEEEFGISQDEITSSEFIGVFNNSLTGEADFAFLFSTKTPEKYFIEGGWKERVKKQEHRKLIRVANNHQVSALLRGEMPEDAKGVMYNTAGVLANLMPSDLQN